MLYLEKCHLLKLFRLMGGGQTSFESFFNFQRHALIVSGGAGLAGGAGALERVLFRIFFITFVFLASN